MSALPGDALALAALVFLFGVRHGFDPDHLVAIDGLTRAGVGQRPRFARWSGLYFSLGHGLVVTLVGIVVALAASEWQAPAWLEQLGAGISIGVLTALGVANLLLCLRARPGERVPLAGIRGRWWAERMARASHPMIVAGIGAAFALSFDTISHALLFSLTGATLAGWVFAGLLGLLFTAGMVVTDTLNGWWVARLAGRADGLALASSRCMSLAIAALCLLLAIGSLARGALPAVDGAAPFVSAVTLVTVLVAYLVARRFAGHGTSAQ